MSINIERLLRLTADYHNFCNDIHVSSNGKDSEELSLEELDFVAAAAGMPAWEKEIVEENQNGIR